MVVSFHFAYTWAVLQHCGRSAFSEYPTLPVLAWPEQWLLMDFEGLFGKQEPLWPKSNSYNSLGTSALS